MTEIEIQPICPLAAGTPYPHFPDPSEFRWNNILEEDLEKFLDRRVFRPILAALSQSFKRLATEHEKLEKSRVEVIDFKLEGFVNKWVMQEEVFISAGVNYAYGKMDLLIKVTINGVDLEMKMGDIYWRPEFSFNYRLDTTVRELLRQYRKMPVAGK